MRVKKTGPKKSLYRKLTICQSQDSILKFVNLKCLQMKNGKTKKRKFQRKISKNKKNFTKKWFNHKKFRQKSMYKVCIVPKETSNHLEMCQQKKKTGFFVFFVFRFHKKLCLKMNETFELFTIVIDECFLEIPAPSSQTAQRIIWAGSSFRNEFGHQLCFHANVCVVLLQRELVIVMCM